MALSWLPKQSNPIDTLFEGFPDNLIRNMMERKKLAQQEKHHQEEMELRRKAAARAGANSDLHRKLLEQQLMEHELKTNPKKLYEFIQQIKQQGATGQQNQLSGNQQYPELDKMFSGRGMFNEGEVTPGDINLGNRPQVSTSGNQENGLFGNLSPDEQMMLGMAGIKIPTVKENPEHKRYADLQAKMQFENYKTQQNKILKQEEEDLKNETKRKQVIEKTKNDLPELENTLNSLKIMEKIAKNNPDLFGHSGFWGFGGAGDAERFAKTTENPNAGIWQTHGLGPIVSAESKMSSRGNQLALRQAVANKPNFEETQPVALGKIKASIDLIKKRIQDSHKVVGDVKTVTVINPDGKKFKTTEDNAKHLPKGWRRG